MKIKILCPKCNHRFTIETIERKPKPRKPEPRPADDEAIDRLRNMFGMDK